MNANVENLAPAPFVFSDSAVEKVKSLIIEEGNPDLKLRVFVQGGGCSGFQYGFTFDEVINEDDTQLEKDGVTLFNTWLARKLITKRIWTVRNL